MRSLQGYPGELVRSSGTDITLDNVLTILCGRAEEGSFLWQTSQAIENNGSLPEGQCTGENIFRLPKGYQGG